jgi:hypothetical protein
MSAHQLSVPARALSVLMATMVVVVALSPLAYAAAQLVA